jgi:hypothetical protein
MVQRRFLMTTRRLVFIVASWIALCSAATESIAATSPQAALARPDDKASSSVGSDASDAARYAERERKAKGLENFRGGEGVTIYIGGGVVAVAVVVVIALLIL